MNKIIEEPEEHIFHGSLNEEEKRAVVTLVANHQDNAILTQQLALDASRLVSISQERLEKQSNAGFCKRIISAISGETSHNSLSNQADILQIQKIAWHYLQQLQQQNMINAQSIAVIRNNLGTINEYIIETRDFLELAIDKINSRLTHVENNTRFANWSLNIEANTRRFKSLPSSVLVVQLTYDFLRQHVDIALNFRDINHLVVTLEKLGINCDEEFRLFDFVITLIEQMEVTGIDRFRNCIALSTDDYSIDSSFIQSNVSGLGFNALYYLSDQYEKISSLIEDDELCNSDVAREKIISRIFGEEFDGLSTRYTLRGLIAEIIGGALVSIDLFREKLGLNTPLDFPSEEFVEEQLSLVSELPDIQKHTYLDATIDPADRHDYVQLLVLCLESPADLGRESKEFIGQLSEKADSPDILKNFTAYSPSWQNQQEEMQRLQSLLTDSESMYCWLFDAFFLLILEQKKIENPQVLRILETLRPPQIKEHIGNIRIILEERSENKIFDACINLSPLTKGWSNILNYRKITLEETFKNAEKKLLKVIFSAPALNSELQRIAYKAINYSFYLESSDGGFLSKIGSSVGSAAFSMGRKNSVSSLNQMRKKIQEFISFDGLALREANRLISQFRIPTFEFNDKTGYSEFELDNSVENNDWSDQFEHYQRSLENTLDSFMQACQDASEQLHLFASGEFNESILEKRNKELIESDRIKKEEELKKKSVNILKNGQTQTVSIEWRNIDNPPCDPESIQHIKTDGKNWLIATNEGDYFLSIDQVNWQQVYPFGPESDRANNIFIVDGIWIATRRRESFSYSYDAREWKQSELPDNGGDYSLFSETEDIIHLNGMWIWRFTHRQEYKYKEKGLILNSEKTSSYKESLFFCAEKLDGKWLPWKESPKFDEGIEVDALHSIPGTDLLMVFCCYDWKYIRDKKKTNTDPFFQYYNPRKGWRYCTWNGEHRGSSNSFVTRIGDRLLCFVYGSLLISEKGYEWKTYKNDISVNNSFSLEDFKIFTSWYGNRIIISQDGLEFKEIILEQGKWDCFCANQQGALSVYSPNKHETLLRIGSFVFQAAS